MIFTERIEKLLAANQIRDVIDEFLEFLNGVPQSNREAKADASQVKTQIIILSGRYSDLNSKMTTNTMDSGAAIQEKSALINSLIQILSQMPSNHPNLNAYLEEKNEEDEWKEAQKKNTILEYQDYFNKYPNGKYKADTIRLITELEDVKNKQELEMKRLAALERERRENDKAANEPIKIPVDANTTQNYQNTARTSSHAAAPVYKTAAPGYAPPPAKSRTGLYIALGLILGILFIIIIAVAVSGNDESQTRVEPQPYTPVSTGWTKSDENNFLIQCQNSVVNMVGNERAVPYCDCILQKMKTKYASYEEANSKAGSISQEELAAMGIDCLK
jgi:hypothetical protein